MKNLRIKFWGSTLGLLLIRGALMAQDIKGKMGTGIQDGVNTVKQWVGYLFGALALICGLIVVYQIMSGQPTSRQAIIGLFSGILVWSLMTFVFG